MSSLTISADGAPVGIIENENRRWRLRYADSWHEFPISPHFPIARQTFEDTADSRPIEWFFENLLPEGRLRELTAFRDRINSRDTWALLMRHGLETAGALSITPNGLTVGSEGTLVPLANFSCHRVRPHRPILSSPTTSVQTFLSAPPTNFFVCASPVNSRFRSHRLAYSICQNPSISSNDLIGFQRNMLPERTAWEQ